MVRRAEKQEGTVCAEPEDNDGGRSDHKKEKQGCGLPMKMGSDHSLRFFAYTKQTQYQGTTKRLADRH
jgi:hypothetical protein